MRVRIYDMIDGGWFYCPIDHINRSRLAYNLSRLWAWNDSDEQRANGDGKCIYIDFGETK